MHTTFKGLLIGGLLPAVLFGGAGLLQKVYGRTEGGPGPYLLFIGLGVCLCGALLTGVEADRTVTFRSGLTAVGIGALWALGMMLIMYTLTHFGTPLSKLAPLYNMNTLIVTVLALVVFSEYRDVHTLRLLAGAGLIVLGGTLVSRA